MQEDNCFITLTYNSESLPPWPHSLNKKHHQEFIRALRLKYPEKQIRFFHGGEYGKPTIENNYIARPHLHYLLFNHKFEDLVLWDDTQGKKTYLSDTLKAIWQKGHVTVGELTHQSAAYVARYCMKKVTGKNAAEHYEKIHPETGEISSVIPEYAQMSLKPGIGKPWYDKYKNDVFPSDMVIVKGGNRVKTPRYYDRLLGRESCNELEEIKAKRQTSMDKNWQDQTRRRLHTREIVKKAQTQNVQRKL